MPIFPTMLPAYFPSLALLTVSFVGLVGAGLPGTIYGVNLGSWLVLESWMLPQEWLDMGGEQCQDCSTCIASEFAFAQAKPDIVDQVFNQHWETWFNQTDVDQIQAAGLNAVRIPLGYWIIEPLVDRTTEFYPRGGILQLQRGLQQLAAAGIAVILDHHALPGVASPNQMFAGRCTTDVEFYTPHNYHRALIWTAIMTALSHIDPAFSSVAAIEAINEPIMDVTQTPGYGDFQKNFVQVVRAVELLLGIHVPGYAAPASFASASSVTAGFQTSATTFGNRFNPEVVQVLKDATLIFAEVVKQLGTNTVYSQADLRGRLQRRNSLVTTFMDVNWQYNNPANPAAAKIGPQIYDNHLYYVFGGVAAANEEAYLTSICNLGRIAADAALQNSPLLFGEWGLPTEFSATDEFLQKWADAQKIAYGKGAGWLYWNFKIEISALTGDLAREWSYMEGIKRGYLTQDPTAFNDPLVCDPYITTTLVS